MGVGTIRCADGLCSECFGLMLGLGVLQVRLYEVAPNGQAQGKAMYEHQGPVLSVCWNKVSTFY